MNALHDPPDLSKMPSLVEWSKRADEYAGDPASHPSADDAARASAKRQLDHLRTYPIVQTLLEQGELRLAAWFYDVERAEIMEWSEAGGSFEPVDQRQSLPSAAPARG